MTAMASENRARQPVTAEERERIERLKATARDIRSELAKRIVGLDDVIEQLLIAIFSGGHCLLLGVPGLAKTLLVSSIAEVLSLHFSRIQFTPDLMPSDITGTELIAQDARTGARDFAFVKGPIFAHVVLADEINRTPPKTQAALMEAMEEQQVTSGGKKYPLEAPFFVLATQNPIEQEGTYPLPVAQLDRFMFNILVDYPSYDEEYDIVLLTTSAYNPVLRPLISREEILGLMKIVKKVHITEEVIRYATAIARATRVGSPEAPDFINEWLSWGCGPRAAQYMILGGKARAMIYGRYEVLPEDIRAVAHPVLRHRMLTSYHAEAEKMRPDRIITDLLGAIPRPDPEERPKKRKSFLARLLGR
jgi:MoxR-like ATPase